MQVKAIRDHFHEGEYRKEGEIFDAPERLHRHIEPADEDSKEPFAKQLEKQAAADSAAKKKGADKTPAPAGGEKAASTAAAS